MTYRRYAAVFCVLLGVLFVGSAEAMVVKCHSMSDGIPTRNTPPLLVVDGVMKGDLPAPGPDSTTIGAIKQEEILRLDVICLEVTEAGVKVRRGAVAVITKAGAVQYMKLELQGLARQQEEFRTRTGEYARNLSSLDLVPTRSPLVIDMGGNRGGWSASATLAGVPTTCRVGVGRAVPGKAAPVVICT